MEGAEKLTIRGFFDFAAFPLAVERKLDHFGGPFLNSDTDRAVGIAHKAPKIAFAGLKSLNVCHDCASFGLALWGYPRLA
jgi:hypothetical protein